MSTMLRCNICGCDKFHIAVENNMEFVSCANCGVRTTIQTADHVDLEEVQ
jgi:transcription elongation factor Elf1